MFDNNRCGMDRSSKTGQAFFAHADRAASLRRVVPAGLRSVFPHWPLALLLMGSGAVNILAGFRLPIGLLGRLGPVATLSGSLAVLGSNTQILLGLGQIVVGVGLFWRLQAAWAFAVLLLVVTVGVDLLRAQTGVALVLPAAMLLLLLLARRYFGRQIILANYLISLVGIVAILAYGTFGTYLLGPGFHPPIHHLTTAFYFAIETLSTVGFGDIVPVDPETRMFAVSLIVVGLSIFATAIATAVGPAISRELNRIFTPGEKPVKPENHVILFGEGAIARNTARELAQRDIAFVQVVDPRSEPPMPDHPVVRGDPSDDAVLEEAGIGAARMVIAARDDDGDNAFIALAAKDLNPRVHVLAVATSARSIRRLKLARADLVFAPAVVGSRLLANLVEGGAIPPEFHDLLEGRPHKA